jgi:hypothetical protein
LDSKWGELGNSRTFPVPLRFCRDRLPKFPRSHVSARRRFAFLVLPCAFRSRTSSPTPTHTALVSLRCAALHCFEVFRHPCFWFLVSTYFLIESCPLFIDWGRKLLMLSSWSCRFCNLFVCVCCCCCLLQVAGILSGHVDVPQRAWMIENGYIIPLLYDASV